MPHCHCADEEAAACRGKIERLRERLKTGVAAAMFAEVITPDDGDDIDNCDID
jgi:hypothetical protein